MSRLIELVQVSNWAIVPEKLDAIHDVLARHEAEINIDWDMLAQSPVAPYGDDSDKPYSIMDGGVAVIPVHGVIAKRMNMFSRISGGTSSELIGRDFRAAMDDPDVRAILLHVDSPGGTVDGTDALASRIYESKDIKPVVVFADGLMASAAYWIGSAGHMLITEPTGEVGSIGVVQAHYDYSVADAKEGVKRTYIYAGKYKTIGNDAEPLTEDGKAYLQAGVDYVYSLFVNTVARHRGISIAQALSMAEGRIFIGQQAREIGLIDRIGTFETALEIAQDMGFNHYLFGRTPNKEDYIMPDNTSIKPVTLERLEAEAPDLVKSIRADAAAGVDLDPAREQGRAAERDHILALAKAYFGDESAQKFEALVISGATVEMYEAMKAAMPKEQTAPPSPDKMGEMLDAIQQAGAENPGADGKVGGPTDFNSAWKGIKAEKNCSTAQAMKLAVRTYPDLHKTYLENCQAPSGRA